MSASDTGYRADALIGRDIAAYLKAHEEKTMLRFITCGSVDDGKSTLIGRLLYDSKMIFDDQLRALEAASKRSGTQGDAIDFALLVDGLAAERDPRDRPVGASAGGGSSKRGGPREEPVAGRTR